MQIATVVEGRPSTRSPRTQQSHPTDAAAPRGRAPRPQCAVSRRQTTHTYRSAAKSLPQTNKPLAAASQTAKCERPRSTCARASPRCVSRPARGRIHATSTRDFLNMFYDVEIKFSRIAPLRRGAVPTSGKRRLRRVQGKRAFEICTATAQLAALDRTTQQLQATIQATRETAKPLKHVF